MSYLNAVLPSTAFPPPTTTQGYYPWFSQRHSTRSHSVSVNALFKCFLVSLDWILTSEIPAPQFLVSGVLILPSGNHMCFMNVKLSMTTSLGYDLVLGCGMRDIIKYMPELDPDAPGKTWETARTTMLNLYSTCDEAPAFDGKNGWITIQI
ncbi:hypothetical protein B0H19DRAFT_1276698 [Mycena capillaripes]|nr:hypothetical protein B0H19DRAFT_1276698 [Mycena capillaripes]